MECLLGNSIKSILTLCCANCLNFGLYWILLAQKTCQTLCQNSESILEGHDGMVLQIITVVNR